jgi:hypothetical protein
VHAAKGIKPALSMKMSVPVIRDTPMPSAVPTTLAAMLCDPILAVTSPERGGEGGTIMSYVGAGNGGTCFVSHTEVGPSNKAVVHLGPRCRARQERNVLADIGELECGKGRREAARG